MNARRRQEGERRRAATGNPEAAWTLLEALGVLAILAVVVGVSLPWMLRDLETRARVQESHAMTEIARALGHAIRQARAVPDAPTWAAMAATALGCAEDRIQTNARGGRRLWIEDPRLRLGPTPGAPLPFEQSDTGSQQPNHARVVLLSSLGEPPPLEVREGVAASTAAFDALWTAAPEAMPEGWEWDGRVEDLILQRMDLTEHWVPVLLHQPDTGTPGQFGIDLGATNAVSPGTGQTWYLRGTVLRLHHATGSLQASLVLQAPVTLTFERGAWRGRPSWADPRGHWHGPAVEDAVNRFLGAPENPEAASAATPTTLDDVWRSMSNYFTAYLNWSADGFPSTGPGVEALESAAVLLDTRTETLLTRP